MKSSKYIHYLFAVMVLQSMMALLYGCSEKEPEYKLLDGANTKFSDYRGKVVLINYWATWCKPCRVEIPELNHFAKSHAEDVVILGVNFDGVTGEELIQQTNAMAIEFPILLDDPKSYFGVNSSGVLPETLVIDRKGRFLRTLIGPQTEAELLILLDSIGK